MNISEFLERFAQNCSYRIDRKARNLFGCRHTLRQMGIFAQFETCFDIVYYQCLKCAEWFKSTGYSIAEQEKTIHTIDIKDVPEELLKRIKKSAS